jgi:2-keto-4-pentenoate hydratase
MLPNAISEAAQLLVDARRATSTTPPLPASCRPTSLADAYAIQSAFRSAWQGRIAGWKVGATARPIMAKFGITEPLYGPFFAEDVYASPARPKATAFQHLCLETEFSFRLGARLPPRAAPYSRAEVAAAVDAVVPSFELISPRFPTIPFDRVYEAIADCGLNGGMVLAEPVTDWRRHDLVNHKVTLTVDGDKKGEGTGALALDDPVNVLEWCVNALSKSGIALEPGQLIATGTTTGVVFIEKGARAVGDFGTLGKVEVAFT